MSLAQDLRPFRADNTQSELGKNSLPYGTNVPLGMRGASRIIVNSGEHARYGIDSIPPGFTDMDSAIEADLAQAFGTSRRQGLQDYELPDGRFTAFAARDSRLIVASNEGAGFVPEDFDGIPDPDEYIDEELDRIFNHAKPDDSTAR